MTNEQPQNRSEEDYSVAEFMLKERRAVVKQERRLMLAQVQEQCQSRPLLYQVQSQVAMMATGCHSSARW